MCKVNNDSFVNYLVPNYTFLGRPWVFGQNKDTVLPAICHILDNVSYLKDAERGDPVKVRITLQIAFSGDTVMY